MEKIYKKGDRVTLKDGSSTRMATVVADGMDSQKRVRVRPDNFPMDMSVTTMQSGNMYIIEKMAKGSTVNGGGVDTELKEALGIADGGGVFTQDFFDKYELVKETYSTKKNPNADELAKNRKKELQEQGFLVKMRKVSFEDLARSVGYFIIAVKRKNETYAKGSTVEGVVEKLVGSYGTKEKAEKMKKVFENAVSTEKGESFYIKKIQNPKSELKYDLFKIKGYAKGSTIKGGKFNLEEFNDWWFDGGEETADEEYGELVTKALLKKQPSYPNEANAYSEALWELAKKDNAHKKYAKGSNVVGINKYKIKNLNSFDKFYDEIGYTEKELSLPKQDENKNWYTVTNDKSIAEILINEGFVEKYAKGSTVKGGVKKLVHNQKQMSLKDFWSKNNNKKIYFVQEDTEEGTFEVGSQTKDQYEDSQYWEMEGTYEDYEEAIAEAKRLAKNENSPNSIYVNGKNIHGLRYGNGGGLEDWRKNTTQGIAYPKVGESFNVVDSGWIQYGTNSFITLENAKEELEVERKQMPLNAEVVIVEDGGQYYIFYRRADYGRRGSFVKRVYANGGNMSSGFNYEIGGL